MYEYIVFELLGFTYGVTSLPPCLSYFQTNYAYKQCVDIDSLVAIIAIKCNETSLKHPLFKNHPFKRPYLCGTDCSLGHFSVMRNPIQETSPLLTSSHASLHKIHSRNAH